jgi:hypothetical protein
MAISNIAAEIRIPAPNAVSDNICCSENFIFFEIIVPTNEVPPAKAVIAITVMMSIASMGVVIISVWLNYSKNKDNINGLVL